MAGALHRVSRALVPLGLALASDLRAADAADLAEIRQRGTLRVIVWTDTTPELFALAAGASPGFEREILEGFAGLHRLRIEIVPVPTLAARLTTLTDGRGDVAAGGLAVTASRRETVDFTVEVFPLAYVVVTLKPRRVDSLEVFRRERVGTVKNSSWAEQVAAAGVPSSNVDDSFASITDMVAALRAKKVSAIVLSVRLAMLEQKREPNLELGMFVGEGSSGSFAVRMDSPELRQALDEYLVNTRRTATWNRLVVKYFGERALEVLKRSRE